MECLSIEWTPFSFPLAKKSRPFLEIRRASTYLYSSLSFFPSPSSRGILGTRTYIFRIPILLLFRRPPPPHRRNRERRESAAAAAAVCITNPSSLSAVTSRYSKVFLHRHIRPPAVCLFFAPQRTKELRFPLQKKVFFLPRLFMGPRSSPPYPKASPPQANQGKKSCCQI